MRSAGRQALLAAFWVPLNFQNAALLSIAVPAILLRFRGVDHIAVFAMLASLVAAISMVVPPIAGEISDRLHRAGHPRRPAILIGALTNAAGLVGMVYAATPAEFVGAVVVATLGQNVSLAAYSALIPEVVPRGDWGAASGYQGVGTLVGSIAGLTVAGFAGSAGSAITLWAGAVIIAGGSLTLLFVPEHPMAAQASEHAHVSDWPNFAIAFTSRFWTNFGLTLLNTFILYFFSDILKVKDASGGTALVGAMAMAGAIVSSIATGYLSDRIPRRYVVAFAGIPMALAAAGFGLLPSERWIVLYAIFFGLGYGAIVSTGWALAIDSVPKLGNVARDLGIWGVAANLPAIVAPQAGRWILHEFAHDMGGYRALFIASGACFILGSLFVLGTGRRRASASGPSLPHSGGFLLAFAMAVIHPYYMLAYRIRGWGRLPRKRAATLLLSNHQHDLDTTILIMRLAVQGPWSRPIFMAGSRRMFEPGFMEVRVAWLAPLVRLIDWGWMFGLLGVLPIENELRRRSAASLAWAVFRRHGDVAVAEVFDGAVVRDGAPLAGNGSARISSLIGRMPLEKTQYISLARLREPYRSEIVAEISRQVPEDLARLEQVLRAGGTLYLTPEGRYTTDGRLSRFRTALDRVAGLGTIYLLALSYDPFAPGRLSLLYRVLKPADAEDLSASLAAARPVVVSQLLAAWLRARDASSPFSASDAVAGVRVLLRDLPSNAFADPDLSGDLDALVNGALATMVRMGLLARDRTGGLSLGSTRKDPRFPEVPDILAHQSNFFAETVAALAKLARRRSGAPPEWNRIS